MDPELKKKIADRFEELPEDVQRAIKSADIDKKVRDVAAKNQLHIDQSGALGDEVLMAMMGFTDMADFAENIAENVKVPAEKAEVIAQDIGTALFIPIRESMQEFMEQRALQETILAEKRGLPTEPLRPTPAAPVSKPAMPATPPPAPKPAVVTPPAVTPAPAPKALEPHPADMMLSQKTVSAAPAKPEPYKADPYREPIQ